MLSLLLSQYASGSSALSTLCAVGAFVAEAWDFRAKLASDFKVDDFSPTIYEDTLKEEKMGFCEGPLLTELEVTMRAPWVSGTFPHDGHR